MGAENDIVERLELMLHARLTDEDTIIREAAAEIVRLRVEVAMTEQQKADRDLLLTGTSFMRDGKRIDPATVRIETPAPAMPNGVEDQWKAAVLDQLAWTHMDAPQGEDPESILRRIIKWHVDVAFDTGADVEAMTSRRAAENRDAAGVAAIRAEEYTRGRCDGWEAARSTPAAVPAGEAVAVCGTCNGVGMIGGHRGQTPDSFEQWAEDCPDCTPQPADGEAVAEWQVWHEQDGWGATHPDNVAEYRARGVPVRPLYAHPPAPVRAAPQEVGDSHAFKNFHRSLCARFGYTHDENDWRRDLASLEEHIARMAARPSACELGAVRVDDPSEFGVGIQPNPKARYWQERADFWRGQALLLGYDPEVAANVDAALQHRGGEVDRG